MKTQCGIVALQFVFISSHQTIVVLACLNEHILLES